MSGITGFFNPQGLESNSKKYLEEMLKKIQHRGPDGCFTHINEKQGIAIGQQYLHINGNLATTNPVFTNDKKQVMTANGRFYNYKSIRTTLQMEGHRFISKNDNEIVLPLYDKYGFSFVEKLRGEFAISLFDPEHKKLLLIRDRFGVKPLFYHIHEGCLYWGSEIKAIFAHPKVKRKFSSEGLVHQLMHTMPPGTSAFQDIYAVQPGHMLIIDFSSGSLEINERQYWDLDFPTEKDRNPKISKESFIEQTRDSLLEAVDIRLDADQDVSAYLSGGIDSCSILGMASSLQQQPVKAYTISFDNADYDESHIAKEMAESVNADHEQIILTADELYGDNFANTLWHSERTFYNTLGVAKNLMSRKVRDTGYRVALTGEGSDELFGGYPSFKRDMFRYGMQGGASAEEAESYRKLMDKTNKLFTGAILSEETVSHPAMEQVCGFTPSWIQPWMQTLEIARPLLHNDILEEVEYYDPIERIASSFNSERLNGRHILDKAQYTWSKTMLECQILNWGGDRVDMANAMESRPPFLDHKVAEMAVQIPPFLRIHGNTEKWVLREAMKNIIPETLYKREKFAFMAPPSHTDPKKQKGLQALMDQYMDEDTLQSAKIFDADRLKAFIAAYKVDTDPISLTRKDALINHILGLHILWHHFIK